MSISQGKSFQRGGNNNTLSSQFDRELEKQYENVTGNSSGYKFGSTVLKFEANNWTILGGSSSTTEHGAIYLGTSKDGTIHTWSKNGQVKAPAVQTVSELKSSYNSLFLEGIQVTTT